VKTFRFFVYCVCLRDVRVQRRKVERPEPPSDRNLTRDTFALGARHALLITLLYLLGGCTAPIRADKSSVAQVYRELRHSAVDGTEYSNPTRVVLRRYDWEKAFRKEPAVVLKRLHDKVLADERRDLLFALAELNYLYAERLSHSVKPGEPRYARDFFLSASIYAWFYVLAEATDPAPNPFELRLQLARDFYNKGLAQGLISPGVTNGAVSFTNGSRGLMIGPADMRIDASALPWPIENFTEFVMADTYSIHGLSVRNRQSGLGAPLIATGKKEAARRAVPRMAVTAFLRVQGGVKEWSSGQLQLSLELHSGYTERTVQVGGRTIPLATDATAPLAYGLNSSAVWRLGLQQFLSSRELIKSGVYSIQPYQPGAIPIVFVHGTLSSPVYWAEMWNTLESDPVLRARCQFWVYVYNSGNPVTFSAANLRDGLADAVKDFDPQGKDSALQQMVLIGHSQGGLLAKMCVTRSEDKLWRVLTDKNLEDLSISDKLRSELRRNLFFEPLPSVKRVVFVSTPHRGSFMASNLARKLTAKLISMPSKLVDMTSNFGELAEKLKLPSGFRRGIPTSLDGMSPNNPLLLKLADMPPAPGVTCHSIISVKGDGPPEDGDDGVVAYKSAHVDYTESELVVRSGHSCQDNPAAIEEVRRILLEHLAAVDGKAK
jgi:pimeloyl-ACP methyl ester carboxylesterase